MPYTQLVSVATQDYQKEALTGENAGAGAVQAAGNPVTSAGLQKF